MELLAGLTENEIKEICKYIDKFLQIESAVVFGSRAIGSYKEASDIDIAIFGDQADLKTARDLKFDIEEESYIPYFVDIVSYKDIKEDKLRKHIDDVGVVIFRRGWREVKLRDIADFNPESLSAKSNWKEINYLDTGNITKGTIDTLQYFSLEDDKVPSRAKRIVRKNDIVYSTVRPNQEHYGIIKESAQNMIVSTGFTVIRTKEALCNSDFLYYFLTLPDNIDYLSNVAEDSTTAYPSITPDVIMDMDITLPSLPEQKAISEVLSCLDDKIDLLNRQNKTLETLAETYFRHWFIENAKDDWEEQGLDEIAEFLNGLPLQKYPYNTGEYLRVIKIKELNNGFSDSSDLCCTKVPEKYIVNNGDIIFSWSGSLQVAYWKYGKGALNQHLFKVTPNGYPNWFCYQWINYYLTDFRGIAADKATTMGHIQRHHLSDAKVFVPNRNYLEQMNGIMDTVTQKIISNNNQVQILKELRESYLPKLISGEIRVKP